MRYFTRSCLVASFLVAALVSNANAASSGDKSFGIQGGISRHEPDLGGTTFSGHSTKAKTGGMVRAYIGGNSGLLGLELGGIGQNRRFATTAAGMSWNTTYSMFLVDLLFRLKLPLISIGVGPYWGVVLGRVESAYPSLTTDRRPSSVGMKSNDYGAVASARLSLPFPIMALTLDARYLHGFREMQFLIGGEFKF
jgi:hypothetical protein